MGKHEVKRKVESGKRKCAALFFLTATASSIARWSAKPSPIRRETWLNLKFCPRFPPRARNSRQAGFLLVVATNQPDVGRGTLKQEIVETIHAEMCRATAD